MAAENIAHRLIREPETQVGHGAHEAGSVKTLALPPRSPNLNAYAERWVRFG
jgi:hypothetical protein